jgi:hypothetical protein
LVFFFWPTSRSVLIEGGGLQDLPDLALCRRAGDRRRALALHVPALARHAVAKALRALGFDWNPLLNGNHAMMLVVIAASGSRSATISCSSSPACSRSRKRDRGGGDRRRGPVPPLLDIIFPLLSPTTFFLLVVNIVYAFFDTFGIIDS